MLDVVLSAMVGGWATDSYNRLINPILTVDYIKAIIIFIGFGVVIVYTTILVLRHWNMLKPYQKESSVDVFSHTNLPSLEDIFSRVEYEIHWVGITLESLSPKIPAIEKLVRDNKRIRILLCDPNAKSIIKELENVVVSTNTSSRIEGTLGMLNKMRDGLGEKKNNLQIKTYNAITTHSMIIVDPISGHGSMQVEPYPFRTPQQYRRVFMISQQHQQNLFEIYWNAFNSLWDYTDEVRPSVSL